MAKQPIAWHEDCLANRKKYLEEQIETRRALDMRILDLRASIYFAEMQIALAKKRGVASFDPERFLRS